MRRHIAGTNTEVRLCHSGNDINDSIMLSLYLSFLLFSSRSLSPICCAVGGSHSAASIRCVRVIYHVHKYVCTASNTFTCTCTFQIYRIVFQPNILWPFSRWLYLKENLIGVDFLTSGTNYRSNLASNFYLRNMLRSNWETRFCDIPACCSLAQFLMWLNYIIYPWNSRQNKNEKLFY